MMEIPGNKCIEFGKVKYLPLKLKWGCVMDICRKQFCMKKYQTVSRPAINGRELSDIILFIKNFFFLVDLPDTVRF